MLMRGEDGAHRLIDTTSVPVAGFWLPSPSGRGVGGEGTLRDGAPLSGRSSQPHEHTAQVDKRREVLREFLEGDRESRKALDPLEEVLDEVAFLVQVLVVLPLAGAGRIRRDDDYTSLRQQLLL